MKIEIKETRKTNGMKIYTLFIDNKIIAQCKDIDKLKKLKKEWKEHLNKADYEK